MINVTKQNLDEQNCILCFKAYLRGLVVYNALEIKCVTVIFFFT